MKSYVNSVLLAFLFMLITIPIEAQYKASEWAERDTWMHVPEIFKIAKIGKGSIVADVGCHEGYLSIHMAKQVGPTGKVYAVDINKNRLNLLENHLKERGITNVEAILGDYDDPKLPQNMLDVVVVMDTYHEMEDYMAILRHLKKSLKKGGRIVLIEKMKAHLRNKTRKQQTYGHTLAMRYVKEELLQAGFTISKEVKNFGIWENDPNKKIWVLVGSPKE